MFYKDNLPQECLCAGAIFYNGDGESLGWLDAARRRTGEGRGNRYHQDVYCDDDGLVDYDNVESKALQLQLFTADLS